ncbi:hypothetical protein [Variovorax sp. LT1R16]|uniref:hypothetical protein n=1 Tax=Variovorax sp. LT1R16 TaxID=3443728 RepID=UPI003F472462
MRNKLFSPASATVLGLSLAAVLASGGAWAQTSLSSQPSQQVQARVISATQVTDAQGRPGYEVAYEYEGRRYTTHSDYHPGATIPIEVNAYGVAALPTSPQSPVEYASPARTRSPWESVVPERGVVVSGGGAPPAPVYYAPPVVYSAPVYAPAPVYVQPAYGYGYGYAPYAYPPIGLSLNLGYSRGWGGGRGRWR